MITLADIKAARQQIHGVAVRTPLVRFPQGTERGELYLKLESLQPIGSFKLRGAYTKIASLTQQQRSRGVITYSSGNHAQGVAYAARAVGAKAVVVMPRTAPQIKADATRALGAEVEFVGPASSERQQRAEQLAEQHGYCVIPPYNDPLIIAGQGTIAVEILEDLAEVTSVLVPIGGGGLISGVAAAIKLTRPSVKVIGVEPATANDAQQSFRAGRKVTLPAEQTSQTIADGLRTQSVGDLNFEHIRQFVDDVVTVSDDEIRQAMRRLLLEGRVLAEPSGAVTSAAWLYHRDELPPAALTVAIISGGNAEPSLLRDLLQ
ncbi:MAG TPA: threonine/serine dehydratase [Terriglobales bacterium]|nr:threonine/serine dehydratase [Terriglobales bacterium]